MMFGAGHALDLDGEDEEALSHVAMALHQRVRRLAAAAIVGVPPPAKLTAREIECLHWVLEGKTNWEIGVVTGVTARTVQFHLGNAARKLGVVNRVQAAVSALIRGDLTISGLARPQDVPRDPLESNDSSPSKFCAPFSSQMIALHPRA
jgi:DNA-binding CsgD family transcriptional regulator